MKSNTKVNVIITSCLFLAFIVFTILVKFVDVQPIGPNASEVGFASLNDVVYKMFKYNQTLYDITEILGIVTFLIIGLFAVLGVVIFFWFSFHQNGTSLSCFARDFVDTTTVAPEIFQAINPFFVIVLTPVIMFIFAALSKRGKEISTPRKIAIGMLIAGLAYVFLAVFSYMQGYPSGDVYKTLPIEDQVKTGAWVLILFYFFMTVAELFISPLGLSFVSKVAPKHLQGLCQGLWLGATAIGNLFLFLGTNMYNAIPIWQCWTVFFILCLISMGTMLAMVKWL